ncbi:MAG TPA: GAF domain-containing protein [Aggregatilinea sp.]|uniref:GAF domain-containing protein n=1 Tax=Aggregatilinea sp. TaxID=2806333 RepID=UPI002BEDD58A|nr:GAF domain-containing protein [Aggregatilinea sp.]HML22040.1 GAF domain-containing protein [Aggregatilinea sp.]
MAYLLIPLICLYIFLATVVFQRQPRGLASLVLTTYLLVVAVATACTFIIDTTLNPDLARIAFVTVILASIWIYFVLLPLTLLGLYYESWFRLYRARVLAAAIAINVVSDVILLVGMGGTSVPLVLARDQVGFAPAWIIVELTQLWPLIMVLALASHLLLIPVLVLALKQKRIRFWRTALPFQLISLASVLIPILSPLVGWRGIAFVTALGLALPVLYVSILALKGRHEASFGVLLDSLVGDFSDGYLVLDADDRVVRKNASAMRWIGARDLSGLAPVHALELVRGSDFAEPVERMLRHEFSTTECEVQRGGEEYVVRLSLTAMDHASAPPGTQLLTLRDITASRIRHNLNERSQELMALSAISADISASLELDQVIARALSQVLSITRLNNAVVYLLDEHQPGMLILAGSSTAPDNLGFAPETLVIDESTAGQVIRTHETVVTASTDDTGTFSAHLRKFNMRSGITVPLVTRSRVIGVLQLGSEQAHNFDQVEVAMLSSVARQIAVAIDNARLHSQERHQRQVAEALREVASILSSMKLDEALQAMLQRLSTILDFDRSTVLLLAEPGRLRIRAYHGFTPSSDDKPLSDVRIEIARYPYMLQMFTQRAPQLVSDTVSDAQWIHTGYHHGSWIGVPLIIHDQVLGCLSIAHTHPGHFTDADLQIATAFAGQTVIAVENAQLFENEQQRRLQAEMLQHASYDLVSSADLDSALSLALNTLNEMLDFDQAHIGLLSDDNRQWTLRAIYPPATPLPAETTVSLSVYPLSQRIFETKRGILVTDTRQNRWWRTGQFSYQEVRCWIGAPLVVRDSVIGFLHIDSYEPHKFTTDSFQLVQTFANQVAAAIENFRLLEEASRQNRALSALNTILAASNEVLTQNNLVVVSLERVLETLNISGGTIHHRDTATNELRLLAASGLSDEIRARLACVPDAAALPSIRLADGQTITFYSVPLVSHGTGIGLLSVCEPETPFSAEVKHLLANIGQQLGVVMDNAVLFENTLRREALSTDMGRLGLAISSQLDSVAVLNLICQESAGVFGAQGAYLWLIEGDRLVGASAHGPGAERFVGSSSSLEDETLLPSYVIHQWRPHFVNRVAQSTMLPPEFIEMTHAQAVIAVPLVKAEVPIGTLLLVNTENPDAYADWLTEQIRLLGVQAALTIQNATLFDEIRHHLDQLRLVNEVGRYATAILSLPNLIEGVARKLFDILHYDVIGLLQVEDDQLVIHSLFMGRSAVYVDGSLDSYYLSEDGVAWQAMQQSEPVLQNRISSDLTAQNGSGTGERCSLGIPLIVADEVIGVLIVERQRHFSITPEDLNVLEPLAAQLAISVSNARLFERVRQQTLELEARVVERTSEIREQQERTEAILRSVADAVIVFDLSGHVVLTNPMANQLFEQHDLNMDLSLRIRALVNRVLYNETETNDATEIIEIGSAALQAKAARVLEGDQTLGSVVVLRDISQLQELDRMKDHFVSNVSHELRTPLANLKLYLSLLQQGRPERRASYLEVMGREVERLERLIVELLDLSRLQSEQRAERPQVRQVVDVQAVINTVVQNNIAWAESAEEELRYESLNGGLPMVYGDPDQLVRALTNLVSNAINYTPPGGQILVRSAVGRSEQGEPEWVIIETVDTGIGIPADEIPNIFDRFYRGSNVNPNVPGTGLGLAIIKEIMGLHGGSIEVESEQGRGSTFRLKLPVYEPQEQSVYWRDGNGNG